VRVDAALFFVLFGVCLVVHELGALSRGKRIAAEHPGVEGMPRRKRLIIQGVWYAMVAVLIIAWWFGSVFAGEMLFLVFVITALVAALTVRRLAPLGAEGDVAARPPLIPWRVRDRSEALGIRLGQRCGNVTRSAASRSC
jgi:hypothetical protein